MRTVASGVCHGDLHVIHGDMRRSALTDDAIVLGHEAAGVVEAVGPDVTYGRPGDQSWAPAGCVSSASPDTRICVGPACRQSVRAGRRA